MMLPDFSHPHFAEPAWLVLALLAPVLLVLLMIYAGRARRRQLARLADPEFLAAMLRGQSAGRRHIKQSLLVLAIFVIGLALARPQWGEREEKSESLGEDVVFLLDCSESMQAPDVKPSRIGRAKLAINDFVQHYSHGRVGLVAFAGQAFLQCPLTFDYDSFRDALNAVDDSTIPVPGTDIGRALAEGYAAVAKNDRRKILVLISDGEDLEKASILRAKELAATNVLIFTVGVGTPAGSELMMTDAQGNRTPLRDPQGQIVVSRLDEATMRQIAEVTHGTYQPLGPLGQGLNRIRSVLENEVGIRSFVSARKEGVDHFQVPVALVLILVVVESLLGTRRKVTEGGIWSGWSDPRPHPSPLPRGEGESVPASGGSPSAGIVVPTDRSSLREVSHKLPLVVCLFLLSAAAQAAENDSEQPPTSRELFNQGTQKLKDKNLHDAETALDAAVTADDGALQPAGLYNLGYVRFRAGQEMLKNAPKAGDLGSQSGANQRLGTVAIKRADTALAADDLSEIMEAYQFGRLTSHSLKQMQTAVKNAMDTNDKVMARWLRSWGDFKSAVELKPNYENAKFNADIVDRNLQALKKQQQQMAAMMQMLGKLKQDLKGKLDALKKKMPGDDPGKGGKGGDEDDGDEPKKPDPNGQENQGNEGQQQALTPDEAMQLLSSLHSDLSRKLSVTDGQAEPKKKNGRNW